MQQRVASIHSLKKAAVDSNREVAVVADPWREATAKQQATAMQREEFIRPILDHILQGASANVAVRNLLARVEAQGLNAAVLALANGLGRAGKAPGRSTLLGWVKNYQGNGINGLLDKHTGRVRKDRGWEVTAIEMYNIPSKPSFSAVAIVLREQGFNSATDSAVRRFLKALPARLNSNSPARLGKHYHQQNRGRYVMRDASVLDVGEVYQGDGHTVDCYIGHPNHGGPWRPELTVWIDVRSNYVAGWYLSEAESTTSTLFALSHALISNDHVPAWLHIDNGSGFKAKLMSDESTGFYARFDISTTYAIPGNSKGKGLVERWFRTFRDHHDKFFNGGQDYCGHDMAAEVNRRLSDTIRQGKRKLASFSEYRDSIASFIERYNQRVTKTLDGQSPAEAWAHLKPVAVELPASAVVRPMVERVARRCTIQLHNRHYEHPELVDYEGRSLRVEFDLHDDQKVWVYDAKNRLIVEAELKTKVAYLPESRLIEARKKREKGRLKRLERKADLIRAEEATPIDPEQQLEALEDFGVNDFIEHDASADDSKGLSIDLYDDFDDD
ncbi:MAG: transposase [Porticoccaceae bacterium]|nr:transposase [Porticoccaceae bacterium]